MPQPPMRLAPVTNGSLIKCQLSARRHIFISFPEARMAIQDNVTTSCVTAALANPDCHLHFQMRTHRDVYTFLKHCLPLEFGREVSSNLEDLDLRGTEATV